MKRSRAPMKGKGTGESTGTKRHAPPRSRSWSPTGSAGAGAAGASSPQPSGAVLRRLPLSTAGRRSIPTVQFGSYRLKGRNCTDVVLRALTLGEQDGVAQSYGGVDTASIYNNEDSIGSAISESKVPRSSLFVQTKLWRSCQGSEKVIRTALRKSLRLLGTTYLDLWLLHWPGPGRYLNKPPVRQPTGAIKSWASKAREAIDGNEEERVPRSWTPAMRLETWEHMAATTMENAGGEAPVRAIGLCNVSSRQLTEVIGHCQSKSLPLPAVVQNECHPYLAARDVRAVCKQYGIVFQAYASLGSDILTQDLLTNSTVVRIAKEFDYTPAQVLLRWALQHGCAIIPKSQSEQRMLDNICTLDLSPLSVKAMTDLDALDRTDANGQTTMASWLKEYDPDHY